jgi:hypothetical protein
MKKKIDSFYCILNIWDGLRQKTISHYCPFKFTQQTFLANIRGQANFR